MLHTVHPKAVMYFVAIKGAVGKIRHFLKRFNNSRFKKFILFYCNFSIVYFSIVYYSIDMQPLAQ